MNVVPSWSVSQGKGRVALAQAMDEAVFDMTLHLD